MYLALQIYTGIVLVSGRVKFTKTDQLDSAVERTSHSELENFEPTRHEASLTRSPDL